MIEEGDPQTDVLQEGAYFGMFLKEHQESAVSGCANHGVQLQPLR